MMAVLIQQHVWTWDGVRDAALVYTVPPLLVCRQVAECGILPMTPTAAGSPRTNGRAHRPCCSPSRAKAPTCSAHKHADQECVRVCVLQSFEARDRPHRSCRQSLGHQMPPQGRVLASRHPTMSPAIRQCSPGRCVQCLVRERQLVEQPTKHYGPNWIGKLGQLHNLHGVLAVRVGRRKH